MARTRCVAAGRPRRRHLRGPGVSVTAASWKTPGVAVETAAAVVVGVSRVACVARIFLVVLGVAVTRAARHARVRPCLDVEPEGAVGVGKRVLLVAFLAVRSRPVYGVREAGASVIRLVAARALRRSRYDLERLQIAVAVAALDSAMSSHERKSGHVVIESRDAPDRRAMACVAIRAEGAFVKIFVAARAVSVRLLKVLSLVTLHAGDILMKREEILRRVLELDVREGKPGRMAIAACFLEAVAMRRAVAARADRFRRRRSVTSGARDLPVTPEQGKARVGMLVEKTRIGRIGRLRHAPLARGGELERLGAARFEEYGQCQQSRRQKDDEGGPTIMILPHRRQSPHSPPDH